MTQKDVADFCNVVLKAFKQIEIGEKQIDRLIKQVRTLEEENHRLTYEYPDSLLKRDEPMPYKWEKREKIGIVQMCPKCGMMISNWQNYCHSCGQKIANGNPLPEMEVKQ